MHKILDEREQCDLECLSMGAFDPLNTYMSKEQYDSCLDTMRIDDLTVFPIPITCSVPTEVPLGTVLELRSATGIIRGSLTVSECWPIDVERECTAVFGCFDDNHPYIQYMMSKSDRFYVSGTLDTSSTPYHNTFLSYRKTPSEIKSSVAAPLIGFQTRNPLHRSHMELIMNCSKKVPGATVLLHPVEGVTQECDIPFPVRMKCYQEVLPYLPQSFLSILPLSMRMAGPREAVWHAVIRRNYGCTHFIVGRDHAGPSYKKKDGSSFFHPLAAQQLASSMDLGIVILTSQEVVYCEDVDSYKELSDATNHVVKNISGTAFRSMLEKNLLIPSWYSYPGVVQVLQQFYQRPKGMCFYFVGLSGSGKSTLAEILQSHLEEVYPTRQITLLDADIIRTHLSKGLGFSKEDRSMNVRRIGYVASEIVRHGGIVIVANIAPFEEDREWNRKAISQWGDYIQIYVDTPVEECERRDVKGLYKAARAGTLKNFTGVSDPFEVPTNSYLTLSLQSLRKTSSTMFKSLIPFFEK
jgi:sulfate adenylyltransferase